MASGDKHVTMMMDEVRGEIWLLARGDDHIVPNHTILGGYGSGSLAARKEGSTDVVPFSLPLGDKSGIQVCTGTEDES